MKRSSPSQLDVLERGHDQPHERPGVTDGSPVDRSSRTADPVRRARVAPGAASQVWPLIAVAGLVVFVAGVIVAGVRNPDSSWISEGISGLGAQNAIDPAVMNVAFLALAVAMVAAGLALYRLLPGKSGAAASIIVILTGLGQVAVAFVRQDCSTGRAGCVYAEAAHTLSASQTIHQVIALGIAAALVLSLWLMSTSLRSDPNLTALARTTFRVAAASTIVFVWLGSQAYGGLGGIAEKLEIALLYGWPVVLAVVLTRHRFAAIGASVWWNVRGSGVAPKTPGDGR